MTPSETAQLLGMIQMFWPEHKTGDPDAMAAAWHMVLDDFAFAEMRQALKDYVREDHPFPPKPGQLVAMIAAAAYDDLIPELAWSEVMTEVRRHPYGVAKIADRNAEGFWKTVPNPGPSFSHPLIAKVVDGFGWQSICKCEDVQKMQSDFTWALKHAKQQAKTAVSLPERHKTLGSGMAAIGDGE